MVLRLVFLAALTVALYASDGLARQAQSQGALRVNNVNQVILNPRVIKQTIPRTFYGINYVGFWDSAAGSAASARALSQTPIRTVRFPGGAPADWYDWQNPYYKGDSHTSPAQLWHYTRSLGGTRVVFGTNYQGHLPKPPGQSYGVNSPENAAAWVKYDKKSGIHADMEVGNEEDMNLLHKANDPAYTPYLTAFTAQAKAMHHADPHVRVLGPAGTNEYYWWTLGGLSAFLRATGNRTGSGAVDGVSLHFYRGQNWLDAKGSAQYWLSRTGPWAAIQQTVRTHDTRKLPVYITEWNIGGADQNSSFAPTLGHALVVADMIGAFAQSGVKGEDIFDTHGGHTWGLLYGTGEDRPLDSPTPAYYAMALWNHMGNHVIDLHQSDDAASVMSTYATTRDDGSVQVLAINKQPSSRTVTVLLQGASPAEHQVHVYSLVGKGTNINALDVRYNGVAMPSAQRKLPGPISVSTVHGRTLSYKVPGYSAVVLDLSGTSNNRTIRWRPIPTASPAPAVQFIVKSKVALQRITPPKTQSLQAALRVSEETGPVLVDLEVYDNTNKKVFQMFHTVTPSTSKPSILAGQYAVPIGARPGLYHFYVGVFGPNWSPEYLWKADAGSFTVSKR